MNFIATDGTVFENRREYRKYEMETQYTFRNKSALSLTKEPGTIQGQPFDIVDCENCVIEILDFCDQVQIDNVKGSRIFIGASSESIFVRDCKDCFFTVACKQLRTRDCHNCTFYLYCKTEPVIETSSEMRFAPFNGAYSEHAQHMRDAGLDAGYNLWFGVYDFNDEKKLQKNWTYINQSDEDEVWCPRGPADNCCPRTEVGSIPLPSKSNSSVGHSHRGLGLDCNNFHKNIETMSDTSYHDKQNDINSLTVWERFKQKTQFIFERIVSFVSSVYRHPFGLLIKTFPSITVYFPQLSSYSTETTGTKTSSTRQNLSIFQLNED